MRRPLGIIAAVLLLTGCAGDPEVRPESGDSSSPTTSTSPTVVADPLTRADVNGAIRAFSKAGTGSYYVRGTLVAEAPAVTHTGRYDLGTGYADEFVTPAGIDGPSSKVRTIAIESDSWIAVEVDIETCWMHFTPDDAETFGVDLGAGSLGIPPVGYVVSTLRAEEDGSVTSDLYSVLLMFSGKTPRALGIAPDSPDRVPVTLDLRDDGTLDRISASPGQLVAGIEGAGLDLGPLEDVRDDLSVTVQLKDVGERVDVVPAAGGVHGRGGRPGAVRAGPRRVRSAAGGLVLTLADRPRRRPAVGGRRSRGRAARRARRRAAASGPARPGAAGRGAAGSSPPVSHSGQAEVGHPMNG